MKEMKMKMAVGCGQPVRSLEDRTLVGRSHDDIAFLTAQN